MSAASLTTINAALKEFWENALAYQLNDKILLLNRLQSTTENLYGRYALIPLHTGRSGGLSARPEYGTIQSVDQQRVAQAQYTLKYLYGRGGVSGPSMELTSSKEGSVVSIIELEMNRLLDDAKVDAARQLYGTGDGKVTQCGVTAASATIVLSGTGFNEAVQKGQIYVGMFITIGTVANPVLRTVETAVTGIVPSGPSITVAAGALTTAITDFVFRSGNAIATSVSYEISGLQQAVATAANTFGGIDASTAANSYWDNLRIAQGGNLTLDAFTRAFNTVNGIAGGNVSCVITSFGVQRAFYNLLQSQVRYMNPMTLASGYQSLDYMGVPVIADKDAPYGNAYFLDERFFRIYSNQDWHWMDDDGKVLKWVANQDAWQFVLRRYMNLGMSRRNCQLVMSGIQVAGAADPGA